MRLSFLETQLSRDEHELGHFLAGFLPYGRLLKLRQLLQLGLGELLRIGGDRVLLDAFPIHILGQKPLQDLSLRSELGILLKLVFHDLVGDLRQALIDLHHEEQVLSSLAMAVFISQSDDRGESKGNRDQAIAQQHSHHTILLWVLIPHAGGAYPRRGGMLHTARSTMGGIVVPILLLLAMPVPGSGSDAQGNSVAVMGCPSSENERHALLVHPLRGRFSPVASLRYR